MLVVLQLPENRGERVIALQKYLLSTDKYVSQDAYNEFALTEYTDLVKVKAQFDMQQIRTTVKEIETDDSALALNYTLLGICGSQDDVPLLRSRIESQDDVQRKRLDALLGSYIMLAKEDALKVIDEKLYTPDLKANNFSRIYRILLALRFHGDDGTAVQKADILVLVRKLLAKPQYADLVLPDLARWEDWSVMDRVLELYRDEYEQVAVPRQPGREVYAGSARSPRRKNISPR